MKWMRVLVLLPVLQSCGDDSGVVNNDAHPQDGVLPAAPSSRAPVTPSAKGGSHQNGSTPDSFSVEMCGGDGSVNNVKAALVDLGLYPSNPVQTLDKAFFPQGCESVSFLSCVHHALKAAATEVPKRSDLSARDRQFVISKMQTCGTQIVGQQFRADVAPFAKVTSDKVFFWPFRAHAVTFYDAQYQNYDSALIEGKPIGVIPTSSSCDDGRCLESPISIKDCKGCENIRPGQKLAVFILTEKSQSSADVTRVTYLHE